MATCRSSGFLDLHNRVNVMLTRAKLGMIIVSKKSFIAQAQQTLVGRLADHWSARTRRIKKDGRSGDPYDAEVWVYFRDVMEGRADLPGADGEKEKYMDLKMPDETLVSLLPINGSRPLAHMRQATSDPHWVLSRSTKAARRLTTLQRSSTERASQSTARPTNDEAQG